MNHAEIISKLRAAADAVEKVDADKLRGVAVIAMPDGAFIETIISGSELGPREFLQHVASMIAKASVDDASNKSGLGYPSRR